MDSTQPTRISFLDAIHHNIYYQDEEILNKILNINYNEELIEISQETINEFELSFDFLDIINNESIRRYLTKEKKLDEYMKIYNEKYKPKIKKDDNLEKIIQESKITEISVGDDYGYNIDTYKRDANLVIVTDEQKDFNQKKISYYQLIHEEYQ